MEVTLKHAGEGEFFAMCVGQWKLRFEYIYMVNVCTMGWN